MWQWAKNLVFEGLAGLVVRYWVDEKTDGSERHVVSPSRDWCGQRGCLSWGLLLRSFQYLKMRQSPGEIQT